MESRGPEPRPRRANAAAPRTRHPLTESVEDQAAQWSENSSDYWSKGELIESSLQAAIDAGTFDVYGVFGPYSDGVFDAAKSAAMTEPGDAKYRLAGGDGQISFDAFQLDNGSVPVVLGFEYRDEDAEWDGADDGARVVKSLFAETVIPLSGSLELNLAERQRHPADLHRFKVAVTRAFASS